jgi:hypothetical protein
MPQPSAAGMTSKERMPLCKRPVRCPCLGAREFFFHYLRCRCDGLGSKRAPSASSPLLNERKRSVCREKSLVCDCGREQFTTTNGASAGGESGCGWSGWKEGGDEQREEEEVMASSTEVRTRPTAKTFVS